MSKDRQPFTHKSQALFFKLRCDDYLNTGHAIFTLFAPDGINCGSITIPAHQVQAFVVHNWGGGLDWNGKDFQQTENGHNPTNPQP